MSGDGHLTREELASTASLDAEFRRLRDDFPIFDRVEGEKPLVYLDSAASAQKPRQVIDKIRNFYERQYANVHRGLYRLSVEATDAFEEARSQIQQFIGARDCREIIFTSGTTAAINLVAYAFGALRVGRGDEVIVSQMEHHSNIVPWQLLCERNGATLRVIPINDDGELVLEAYEELLCKRTRLVAVTHTSNALGTRNPVEAIIARAHEANVPVLLDGAQAIPHEPIDVSRLDCEFMAFSGHKMFGPTGIGVLYGKLDLLEQMPPFLAGGEMIHSVSFEGTTYKEPPHRFEAGTPDIAGAVGLGAAVEYLASVGMERIARYEAELLRYGTERLLELPRVRIIGTAERKASILSFVVDGIHPHDLGTVLDSDGIAVRAGHHCAQPVMDRYGLSATSRASLAFYNTREDIDALVAALPRAFELLG